MMYDKQASRLTQNAAIENMRAVITSDYFKKYNFSPSPNSIKSNIIRVDCIGGRKKNADGMYIIPVELYSVADISKTVDSLLEAIQLEGILEDAHLNLRLPASLVKAMNFEKRLTEEEGVNLMMNFYIARDTPRDSSIQTYKFQVFDLGWKKSYFEEEDLNFKDASAKRGNWRGQVTRALNRILPHKVKDLRG